MKFDQDEIKMIAELVAQEIKPMISHVSKETNNTDRTLMNIKELVDYMKVSKNFIYKLIGDKEIPHIKKGNKFLLFRKKEIDKWLDSYAVPALLQSERMIKLVKKNAA